ncbi:MAG: response regulator [Paracoccaceae bacterium]|nr:response regulator [Paracoccaceae bacterium]MDG1371568.1 response regulator [Paracoccaceae bacterium]
MPGDLSVYIVEDDAAALDSLSALLTAHGYETIMCSSAERLLEVLDEEMRACIVLDLQLPGISGMDLLDRLNTMDARTPVIILTAHGDIPVAVKAMRAGAIDFIEKPAQVDQLLTAVKRAELHLNGQAPPKPPKEVIEQRLAKLTEREREVLGLLLSGSLNKEIADQLGVSRRTIEVHRSRVREKMEARSIADLIRMVA